MKVGNELISAREQRNEIAQAKYMEKAVRVIEEFVKGLFV